MIITIQRQVHRDFLITLYFSQHPHSVFSPKCERDQVSETQITAIKTVLMSILVFVFQHSRQEEEIPINQTTKCNNFPSLLPDVYVRLNMFRASSRPSSEAQRLQ